MNNGPFRLENTVENHRPSTIKHHWKEGLSACASSLGTGKRWLALARELHVEPEFRIMDALPEDPRQTTIATLGKLFGVVAMLLLLATVPLALVLATTSSMHVSSSSVLLASCSIFGFTLAATIIVASLEGIAVSCRMAVLVTIAGALMFALFSCLHNWNALGYRVLSFSAGLAVGAVCIWSQRRTGWKIIASVIAIAVVAVTTKLLYEVAEKWTKSPENIIAPVICFLVIVAWALTSKDSHLTIWQGIRLASPVPVLIMVLGIFALSGDPDPNTWYYQLWVGALAGAVVLISDYVVAGLAGRSSIFATPLLWVIVIHPGVAFGHLNAQMWPTIVMYGFIGSVLGGLIAYAWQPFYLRS